MFFRGLSSKEVCCDPSARPRASLQRSLLRLVCNSQLFRPASLKLKPTTFISIYLNICRHIALHIEFFLSICLCWSGWMRVAGYRTGGLFCPRASKKAHAPAVALHGRLPWPLCNSQLFRPASLKHRTTILMHILYICV